MCQELTIFNILNLAVTCFFHATNLELYKIESWNSGEVRDFLDFGWNPRSKLTCMKYFLHISDAFQVFSSMPDSLSLQVLREYESKIDEVCWLICKKNYVQRENALLSDACVYQLFRVFCLLGDLVPDPKCRDCYQVPIHGYLSSWSMSYCHSL